MSTPRRTAGRRPARPGAPGSPRSSSSRTLSRPATQRARAAGDEPSARRPGLTRRAAVLVLVVGALLVSAALPLRELLAQRSDISALRERQAQAQARVDQLEAQKVRLADPAYVAAEARRRLQLAMPGETPYVLIAPTPVPGEEPTTPAAGPGAPWYTQFWGSVRAADAAPTPRR